MFFSYPPAGMCRGNDPTGPEGAISLGGLGVHAWQGPMSPQAGWRSPGGCLHKGAGFQNQHVRTLQSSLWPPHLQPVVPDGTRLTNRESLSFVWTVPSNLPSAPTIGRKGDETEGQVLGPFPAARGHPFQTWGVLCPEHLCALNFLE